MTDFTDIEQTTATNGTTAPQKKRGPKPGAKKAAAKVPAEPAVLFTPQELAEAVKTMMSWSDALRACAMAVVATWPKD